MQCLSAAYAIMWCVCVCMSVCVSVTFVHHVKTNKHIFEIFSQSSSHTILIFSYQTGWRYYDGKPPNGESNAGGVDKKRDSGGISGLCCQPYESRSVKNKAGGKHRALIVASVVHCLHKRMKKCLWQAQRYTPEMREVKPFLGHNPVSLLP